MLHFQRWVLLAGVLLGHPCLCLGQDYEKSLLSDKPVVLYRFEEAEGTAAMDLVASHAAESPASTTGTYHDVELAVAGALKSATTESNWAARFDGVKSRLTVQPSPDVLDITGPLSIEMWIRPTEGGEGTQCILAKGDFVPSNSGSTWYLVYFQNDSGTKGRLRFGNKHEHVDQTGEIDEETYTHLIVTFDPDLAGENTKIYINGKLNQAAHIATKSDSLHGQQLAIGALSYDPKKQPFIQHFKGDLDEIGIYDHVLSEVRVHAHFEQLNTLNRIPRFETDIRPIFEARCFDCHQGNDSEAGLDVTTVTALLRGGENGSAIVRGNAARSVLFDLVSHGDMPPEDEEKLTPEEILLIQRWIDEGAPADEEVAWASSQAHNHLESEQHWGFRQLSLPKVPSPTVASASQARTPIDAFVLEKLHERGLGFSPDTDRRRMVRRAYFDLVGLPPPVEVVDRFVQDDRPDASERLLDRLLASPQFGVRWGRHWLDIVGYTDTLTFDDDFGPPIGFIKGKWKYRDYVVQAFSHDKPYDRFIIEQLAGDEQVPWRTAKEYSPKILEHLVATGYYRCCEDISLEDNRPFIIWSVLHDTVQQIGTSLLGLTLNCARCHSHKFEPVSQGDYYSLMALVTPALNVPQWKNPQARALPDISATRLAEINAHNGELDKQIATINQKIADLKKTYESKLREQKLATFPEPIRSDTKVAIETSAENRNELQKYLAEQFQPLLTVKPEEVEAASKPILADTKAANETPAEKRNEVQKYLAEKLEPLLAVKPEEVEATISDGDKQVIAGHNAKIGGLNGQRRSHGWIQAMYDMGKPPSTQLFKRGDYLMPRREVAPSFLNALSNDKTDQIFQNFTEVPSSAENLPIRAAEDSGRRTAMAHWMTVAQSPASGLVSRVMINRIWQHLLGRGIVPTVENMGVSGANPTHPKLLDWLAADFRDNGWSIKRSIRKITHSSVYRQASTRIDSDIITQSDSVDPNSVDPGNIFLWRARLRRLEAEAIRDAILVASGRLDLTPYGPPVPLEYHPDGRINVASKGLPTPTSQWRRTVFLMNRRIYNPSFLSIFDKPIVTAGVCQRDDAAVALQPLAMMNDVFVTDQAAQLARRVDELSTASNGDRIDWVYRLALSRRPFAVERQWSQELLGQQAKLLDDGKHSEDEIQIKALTELCQTVLNTNEFLYLE